MEHFTKDCPNREKNRGKQETEEGELGEVEGYWKIKSISFFGLFKILFWLSLLLLLILLFNSLFYFWFCFRLLIPV